MLATNQNSKLCIQDMNEYNEFIKSIQTMRNGMSYLNFTHKDNNKHGTGDDDHGTVVRNSIKIFLYAITITIGLVGNILIMFVICFNRKFKKKSTNYFILNLVVCDLAIIVSCMWVQIVLTISKFWILGEMFCKLNSFMQMTSVVASVLTLALISFDRFLGIIYPLRGGIQIRNAYLLILSIWLFAILIATPSFIYRTYTERKWLDFTEKSCDDLGWPGHLIKNEHGCMLKIVKPLKRIYYTGVILVLFFLPIFIMSITYSIIIHKLWRSSEIIGENCSEDNQNVVKKRKRVILILVLLLVIFFICWSPLQTMLLFMEYTQEFPTWWSDLEWISYFMAYSNTAINPFIYAGLSKNYKLGLVRFKDRLLGRKQSLINIQHMKGAKLNNCSYSPRGVHARDSESARNSNKYKNVTYETYLAHA